MKIYTKKNGKKYNAEVTAGVSLELTPRILIIEDNEKNIILEKEFSEYPSDIVNARGICSWDAGGIQVKDIQELESIYREIHHSLQKSKLPKNTIYGIYDMLNHQHWAMNGKNMNTPYFFDYKQYSKDSIVYKSEWVINNAN